MRPNDTLSALGPAIYDIRTKAAGPAGSLPLTDDLRGAWKTPSLRDVALTGPYMHDGMYTSLRDVIVHYNKGGMIDPQGGEVIGTLDDKIKQLNLTDQEIDDLVAFLMTLTGQVDPAVTAKPDVPADSPF